MSHRLSQNARHTQELLLELERDKELEVLRVYLTRYNLFPRKRDPKTAPIRAEELRDLVKHWKLHRQRNFWKAHTTKDELVRTLYKHINTKVLPAERYKHDGASAAAGMSGGGNSPAMTPERPKTPSSAMADGSSPSKKGAAYDRRVNHRNFSVILSPKATRRRPSDYALDPYIGDLFGQRGNYEDGMIYLSRLGNLDNDDPLPAFASDDDKAAAKQPTNSNQDKSAAAAATPDVASRVHLAVEDSASRQMRLKHECACSLYQLTLQSGHEAEIVAEGCVPALVRLTMLDDYEVKKYAAAAIVNLTCNAALCSRMLEDGLLVGLMELAKVQHEDIRRNAAVGLCRLSYERAGQQRLVQEGSVPAMITMLNSAEYETKEACIKAIINIASYSGSVGSESVVYTLVKMAAKQEPWCFHFLGEVACNLSLLSGSRVKSVEEGILETIAVIANDLTADVQVHRLAATALCNFSTVEANHALLSQVRILHCIDRLLDIPDATIRELGAVTIANLTCSPECLKTLIQSNIATRLIQIGYAQNDVIQENVSLALSNLALSEEDKELFLTRSGVVLMLLQFLQTGSLKTQEHAVCTLCSLMDIETSRRELMQCDIITELMALASSQGTKLRELAALSMLNMSAHTDLNSYLLAPDAVNLLFTLLAADTDVADSTAPSKETTITLTRVQESCLHTLYNLSFYANSRTQLVLEGAIAALARVFRKPAKAVDHNKRCMAALCNFTFCTVVRPRIVADDGLRLVKRLTTSSSVKEVLVCASSALCNLATAAIEQPNSPILGMLIDLSHTPHADVALNCAIAFNKLASNVTYVEALAKCADLASSLTLMMRSGIEEVQIHCAAALCGLAATDRGGPKVHRTLWKDGAMGDFIVNALLRINSDSTKEICARVLFNVLTHDDGRAAFIKDGVLYALVKLARLDSVETRSLCVTALYNLSCDDAMIPTLMDINVAQVVSKMCDSDANTDGNRQRLAACLTNVALCPGNEMKLVEGGVLSAIVLLCDHGDLHCLRYSASVLCSLSTVPDCCTAMASMAIVDLLLKMVNSRDGAQCLLALNALCNVSCSAANQDKMEEADAVCAVLRVMDESEEESILTTCSKILCNLACAAKHHAGILKYRYVRTMVKVFGLEVIYPSVADVTARILAALSQNADQVTALVNDGAVQVLRMASKHGSPVAIGHCVAALCQLSRGGHSGMRILEDGLFDILIAAVPTTYPPQVGPKLTADMSERCAAILRTLSTYLMCIPAMVADARLVPILVALAFHGDRSTCTHCVMLLHNLTAARPREFLQHARRSGVLPLLIRQARMQTLALNVRLVCSVALAHINSDLSEADRSAQDAYEQGLVTSLISMLDMDAATIQALEKIAAALPDVAPSTLVDAAHWQFLHGTHATRVLQQIPISWATQTAALDESRFVPPEPSAYMSILPCRAAARTSCIKDALVGTFHILKVNQGKFQLKPAPRNAILSPSTVLRRLNSLTSSDVAHAAAAAAAVQESPPPVVAPPKKEEHAVHRSSAAKIATKPATPKKSKPTLYRMATQGAGSKKKAFGIVPDAAAATTGTSASNVLLPKIG
ncbi:hypothetical protein LEN26_013783 [Aphanomyces euteiches]|nr:hypothetical protein LEN26_013783 [Aphanomyces euteiches]